MTPDGEYRLRVTVPDLPSNTKEDALTGQMESEVFAIDNTPPRIEGLAAHLNDAGDGPKIHVAFRAVDDFSPIKRAEYSVDAGDWKYVDPVGQLSDAKSEDYDFKVAIEPGKDSGSKRGR